MAIKTNSMTISDMGVTLTNSYSKIDHYLARSVNTGYMGGAPSGVEVEVYVQHFANSSSRATSKQPVQTQNIWLGDCNAITGSLVSGSFSYLYDRIKLVSPFSGSTLTDV